MIKAVVCDLDGTLLDVNHRISDYTKDVITAIRNKGIQIFIATGRHHKDAETYRDALGLESCLISSNGAKIHDENNKEIASYNIPADISEQILNFPIDEKVRFNVYHNDLWYANKENDMLKGYYEESGFICNIQPVHLLKGIEVTKFFFVSAEKDLQNLHAFEKALRSKFDSLVDFTYSLPTCLEILRQGVSKGIAVKKIVEDRGISLEETIAFGDGLNDYEMLSVVGKGLIMGNASTQLINQLPKSEVIESNANDGLAKYLEKNYL